MINLTTSPNEQMPNSPIVLADILTTHINGHCLKKPFSARVALPLSPTLMTVIESESFPTGILYHRMEMPFDVTVSGNRDVEAVRSSLRTSDSLNGTARGSLALYKSPFVVTRRDTKIKSISFSVINFPKFFGRDDNQIDSLRVGATTLAHKNLQVSPTQVVSLCDHEKLLKETDGYGVTHTGYRRYPRRTGTGKAFEIDAGKLAEEARLDGIFVLRTNAGMTPLNAVLRYRELLLVEDLFRRAKAQLRTRPIYHSCEAAIRCHVFCSFLAPVLQKEWPTSAGSPTLPSNGTI